MTISFVGTVAKVYTEDDVKIVAFGDHPISPENFLILSRYDDPGADEYATDDDMIGIQTSSSAYEVSGAISSIVLHSNSINITILDEKIEEVGAKQISVDFALEANDLENLRSYLKSICDGSSITYSEE